MIYPKPKESTYPSLLIIYAYIPLIVKRVYVLRKLQCSLTTMESWCEYWNIRINEENTQAIYFSHQCTPVWAFLALKGWQIPFVNHMKYLGVIFYKKISWKLCIGTIAAKALHIFISIYPILKSEHLSIGTKLIIYKALIKSTDLLCLPCVGIHGWQLPFEIAASAKQSSPHHW